ncbi:MAG: hypothetical protein ACOH1U_02250 [Rhodoglobus sp.]
MKKTAFISTVFATVLVLVLPFFGGAGAGLSTSVVADAGATAPPLAAVPVPAGSSISAAPRIEIATTTQVIVEPVLESVAASVGTVSREWENLTQNAVPKSVPLIGDLAPASGCTSGVSGTVGSAPSTVSAQGVAGTTSADLASFATQYNATRIANCLEPISYSNFRYDACMEARLFWMAESPSPDPLDAWGHIGSVRIDGVPSTGCDGNLAGGSSNTGATVALKWWNSASHRASLYRPGSSIAGACIAFAMTHGGIDEPASFVRAAARWTTC